MKIPVTIFTGFLGSGKTTLINAILKQQKDKRVAILVNEFGEVDVDAQTIRDNTSGFEGKIFELPGGCICSAIDENLGNQIQTLINSKYEFDHIILETSGLGVPMPIADALKLPELQDHLELDAILAVVDTPLLLNTENLNESERATYKILDQQLEYADVVVLNKVDQLEADQLLEAEKLVRKKAQQVRFLEIAYNAELDPRLCLGLKVHAEKKSHHGHGHHPHHHGPVVSLTPDSDSPLADQTIVDGHTHDDLGSHAHDESTHMHFHEHDSGWQSFTLHTHADQSEESLTKALEKISKEEPILRAKGESVLENKTGTLNIQIVRTRINITKNDHPTDKNVSRLVFIGYRPDRKNVVKILNEVTETNWS